MRFKKHFLFFIIFNFLFLFLFFPKVSLAQQIISGGCSSYIGQIYYTTGCPGESNVYVGQCFWQDCECCCPDGEGGCSSYDCCGTCRRCSCTGLWDEYQCDSADCGGNIYIKKCFGDREGTCSASNCGSGQQCCIDCHSPDLCQRCESWQRPVRTSCANPNCEDWCREEPKCKCCKECIEPPTNPQYYNDPNNNIVAIHPIKLPVKLAWDDVPGWQGGWSGAGGSSIRAYSDCKRDNMSGCRREIREAWEAENPNKSFCPGLHVREVIECMEEKCKDEKDEIEECNPCPEMDEDQDECYNKDEFVSYYQIEIWSNREKSLMDCGTLEDINSYKAFLEDSEFFAPCNCFFKPGYTYNWRVRGCCEEDEGTCGPWSQTWNFTTERVPEPIWTYDPDWAGQEGAENVSYEDSRELRWCGMKDPDYYRLTEWEGQDYYVPLSYELILYFWDKDTGSITCWDFDVLGNCVPELLAPLIGVGEVLPPETFYTGVRVIKDNAYAWKIRACRQYDGGECSDAYSQLWKFEVTEDWDLTVGLIAPPDNEDLPISLPVELKWSSPYAYSFRYEIRREDNSLLLPGWTPSRELILYHNQQSSNPSVLDLDSKYKWYIRPCWDDEANECEADWFGPWHFRTTGRPPEEFYKPEDTNVLIPVEFSWEQVPGAKSYKLWVDGVGLTEDIIVGASAKFSMCFSEYGVLPGNTYTWNVKTCALPGGEICGPPSSPQTFSTFSWQPLSGLQPEDGESIGTKRPYKISWDTFKGPRFYRYEVELIAPDSSDPKDECENPEPIIASGSVQNPPVTLTDLRCWGQYQWTVTPCLDAGCTIHGDSATQVFDFKADVLGPDENPGLIPCGQKAFYEGRDWLDETEPCGIKHLFIIIFLLTEFLFLNVIPAILVLLVLASGVIFYFSMKMGSPNPAAKVKSIWKAAGIGIGLMVFAWTITSLLLMIFGYNLGPWQVFNL